MHRAIRSFKCTANLTNIFWEKKGVYEVFFTCKRQARTEYKLLTRDLVRNSPKIMKLDTPQFKSCVCEGVKILRDLFAKEGHEIRIVGGAVRDLLMGIQPEDLDFSTTATPTDMKRIFTENNIRILNTNGEKHGTVTSRINDKNFEVTTLRIDIATNGRHAEVEFTKEWVLDANRRDLTINAMYLALDGTLYDYFNGLEDLKNRRIVFVGNPVHRIQEDYLRILRYFRFYGKIAETPDSYNEDIIQAIRDNAHGLQSISGERIWSELNKILTGRFVDDIVLKMISTGIGSYIGFPKEPNTAEFKRVFDRLKMKDITAKPITILMSLFNNDDEFNDFHSRIRTSNIERDLAYFILNNRSNLIQQDNIRSYKIMTFTYPRDNVFELLKYQGKFDFLEELKSWETPIFPIKGNMLHKFGIHGRDVGQVMRTLKEIWYNHDFSISPEELLEKIPQKKMKVN